MNIDLSVIITLPVGFKIQGVGSNNDGFGDRAGQSVASAGDINGDGYSDIIIGAVRASPLSRNNAGESYVIFGKPSGFTNIDLSGLTPPVGFKIRGSAETHSAWSVASAGDFNKDGFADIIIGARYSAPNGRTRAGESYVIFGKNTSFGDIDLSIDLVGLTPPAGFKIRGGSNEDFSGGSVASAGDFNKDGFADIIIGANEASPLGRTRAGESYVIFGKPSGFTNIDLSVNISSAWIKTL